MRIRWRIFSMMFGFGFLAYLQQKSITVAADRIMPEMNLSQVQIGWIEWAFVLGYGLLQLPGGILGQRIGARRCLCFVGIAAFMATAATPLAAYVLAGSGLFIALLLLQLMLGVSQAAIFPVSAGVFETWFPPSNWSFVQGFQTMGLGLGAALAPPLIATMMGLIGWQKALLWASLPAVVLIALWAWYGRDLPREHPSVSAQELAEIESDRADPVDSQFSYRQLLDILSNRSVLLLGASYFCFNYTFYLLSNWVFLYLVQERHFSALESGWLSSAPPLAAAAGAGIGGVLTGKLCREIGNRWGYALVPLIALPAAGLLLAAAALTPNPYAAVASLALCFACVELNEGAFWGAAMAIGRGDSMAVGGVMNTGGNLGGIVGIPIIAYLTGQHLWHTAIFLGAGCAVASALGWLGIKVNDHH